MHDVKRVLVVSRMTKYCGKAVHYGASLCHKYGAELYVIHAVYNPLIFGAWNLPKPTLEEEYKKEIEKRKAELDQIIDAEKGKGLPVKVLMEKGEPIKEIFAAIRENNIDLVIVPAHEEWRLEHFLFGRDNDELTRKMPCSILLVKTEYEASKF